MNDFNNIYEKIYNQYGETLEKLRKQSIYSIAGILGIGTILAIITKNIIFISIAIMSILLYLCFSKSSKKYNIMFKEKVVRTFVKEYSEALEFNPTMGISELIYNDAEFEGYDIYSTEDLISGILDSGCVINMAEIKTEAESTDDEGNSSYSTIFYGLFAEIELNKIINANIQIRKNTINFFDKRPKLEMDSGEFEKYFDVYATDKIIAMQLLTSDIMQMLIDFKEKNKIKPEITLKNNKLYIRFATGNVFESKLMKKTFDYEVLFKYYNIINFTLDLSERFLKNIMETEV